MMEIRKVGILGAGTMGRGIAAAIVQKGVEVLLCERDADLAQTALTKIAEDFDHEISRWAITEADKRSMMKKLSVTANVAELAGTDLVIEAVPEDFDLKVKLFEQLSRLCPPDRVFVTNTSTLSITKMAEQLTGPSVSSACISCIQSPK